MRRFVGFLRSGVLRSGVLGAAMSVSGASLGHAGSGGTGEASDPPAPDRVRCAQERGQALGHCSARAVPGEGDAVRVIVTFPNGFARTLFFEAGAFVRANPTMSGVGTDWDWSREGGRHLIRVDDQRFEIPDALAPAE